MDVGSRSLARLLPRAGAPGRLRNRLTVARALGARAARVHRADWQRATEWGPAARRAVYEQIWADAAAELGASIEPLAGDVRRIRRDTAATLVWFHEVQLGDPVTLRLALDKSAVQAILQRAGVPVPRHTEVAADDEATARRAASRVERCVVKPARGTSSGEGVTCGIRSAGELRRALRWARQWAGRVLVEDHVTGDEYRFLLLDGAVLDAVRRRPPTLTGDGSATVAELVSRTNDRRRTAAGREGLTFLKVDLDTVVCLEQQGLDPRSVPARGQQVAVKSTANTNGAADNDTVAVTELSPGLVDDVRAAASAIGLRFAGVDVITPRTDRPLSAAGGAVIEVNATPGLHYHYLVADRARAVPVARPLLETLLRPA